MPEIPVIGEEEERKIERRLGRATRRKLILPIGIAIVIATLVLVGISAAGWYILDYGEAAIIYDWLSRKSTVVFGPTAGFRNPITTWVKVIYVGVDYLKFEGDNALLCYTRDGARVWVEVTVRYRIKQSPDAILFLVERYPYNPSEDVKRYVMDPIVREVVRDVISNYTLEEVIAKRAELSAIMTRLIWQKLMSDPTIRAAIAIEAVNVKGINLPPKVNEAIERKLAAQQEAEAAKFIYQKEITLANASRMKRIIEAQGEAEAKIIRAEAERRAIELLMKALHNNPQYVLMWKFLDSLSRFNGTLILVMAPGANTTAMPIMLPIRR